MSILLIIFNILLGYILCLVCLVYCNPRTFIKTLLTIFMLRHKINNEGDVNASYKIHSKMPEELAKEMKEQEAQKEETNE